jgi:hypothetical protein
MTLDPQVVLTAVLAASFGLAFVVYHFVFVKHETAAAPAPAVPPVSSRFCVSEPKHEVASTIGYTSSGVLDSAATALKTAHEVLAGGRPEFVTHAIALADAAKTAAQASVRASEKVHPEEEKKDTEGKKD